MQAVDQVAGVILDVADVQVLPARITWIKDVHEIGEDVHNGVAAGQRLVAQVAGAVALDVGGDDRFGDLGQRFLQADVGGHAGYSFGRRRERSGPGWYTRRE